MPATATAGTAFNFTVTAYDAYGNVATGYTGTVHFTSSDAGATLPANYTFTSANAGTHTFSATLKTGGTQTITATDTVTSSITGKGSHASVSHRDVPQAGHDDAGELDRHLRRAGLRHRLRPVPASPPTTPSPPAGQSTYTWTTTSTDPRALQVPGSSNRVAAVWYSATSFTVDVNLADGQTHDLELYFLDWDNKGRGRAGADQRRRHGHGAGHRDDLVVLSRRLPGLEGLGQPA